VPQTIIFTKGVNATQILFQLDLTPTKPNVEVKLGTQLIAPTLAAQDTKLLASFTRVNLCQWIGLTLEITR